MHVSYVHKGVTVLAGFVHVLTAFIHSQAHSFSYSHTLFTYNNTAVCMNEAKERTRVHFVSLFRISFTSFAYYFLFYAGLTKRRTRALRLPYE